MNNKAYKINQQRIDRVINMFLRLSYLYIGTARTFKYSVVALFALISSAVMAEAPDIQGSVKLDVSSQDIVNVAVGIGSVAQVVAGSVLEGDIVGNVDITVTVDSISNAAQSQNSCSQVILGSIGVANCMGGN